jgi:hypothetical protein
MVVDQFDEMIDQCVHQPLVCCLSLHPYLVGQPFRLPPLRKVLRHIMSHPNSDRVWFTTAEKIADHCYAMQPGIIPGS